YMVTAFENIPLWHERDISHSAAERIIIPDATILLDYMLDRFARIIDNLVVFEENMLENIQKTHGLVFSQRLLLKVINKGVSREESYDMVQPFAMKAWENRLPLKEIVLKDSAILKHLSVEEIEDAFDLNHHVSQGDVLFTRVGLID